MASLAHLSTATLVPAVDATKRGAAKTTFCVGGPAPKAVDRAARLQCSKMFSSRASSAWGVSRSDRAQRMMICRAEESEKAETEGETEEEAETEVEEETEGSEDQGPAVPSITDKLAGIEDEALRAELESEFAALLARAEAAEAAETAESEQTLALKAQNVRLAADFDNFRKRTATEKERLSETAKSSVMEQLLPVIDNFELAKSNLVIETEEEKKIESAYQGLYTQMVNIFRTLGLAAVPSVGEPFDPEVHEAIMREPTTEFDDGVIMQEFRKGFTYNGSLLRAAMVKVAQNDEASSEAAASSDDAEAKPDEESVEA